MAGISPYSERPPDFLGNPGTACEISIPKLISPESKFDLEKRFWDSVEIIPGKCWKWTGVKSKGYGRIKSQGRKIFAHRLSFIIHGGILKIRECVLHSCDNPECCNPEHLRKGTRADNRADCLARNRHAKGETIGVAILTDEAAADIRANYKFRKTPLRLFAEKYNCGTSSIHRVVKNLTWKNNDN